MISENDFAYKQILFLFAANGEKLSFSNDNIIVKDKDGVIKHQSTCYRLFLLCVIGNITITSGLIQRANKFGFTICLMTPYMRVYEILGSRMEGNTLLHKRQYEYDRLDIGVQIINNKISNQREILNSIRNKSDEQKKAIHMIDEHLHKLSDLNGNLETLLGIEGSVARIYFRQFFDDFDWKGRKPRIKSDYLNSTLDIGYTILFQIIQSVMEVYGFDLYVGVLHRNFYMRKSLVCDLMEPFRPIIDKSIRKAVNLRQCKEDDFEIINQRYQLKWKKSPEYVSFIMADLLPYKAELFVYIRDYYRAFMKGKNADQFPALSIKG